MTAKEFIQENYPITAAQFERKECVGLNDVAFICDKFAAAKIGWLDYPEHTPKEDQELIVWDGKESKKMVSNWLLCNGVGTEGVTKFMYLENLKP